MPFEEMEDIMQQRARCNPAFTLLSGAALAQYPSESPWWLFISKLCGSLHLHLKISVDGHSLLKEKQNRRLVFMEL